MVFSDTESSEGTLDYKRITPNQKPIAGGMQGSVLDKSKASRESFIGHNS